MNMENELLAAHLDGYSDSMFLKNQSLFKEFVLFGLTDIKELQIILFVCFLIVYFLILIGNSLIMAVILQDQNLHTPMYFFLWNLALLDICYSSVTVPKMLANFLAVKKTISFGGCISQIYFFHFFGSSEAMLYSAMSYDRYVAVGYPLRYSNIMSVKVCTRLVLASWTTAFFHALVHAVMTSRLPFCGPSLVNHFFCDVKPVVKLACVDTLLNLNLLTMITGTLTIVTLSLTIVFYFFIGKFLVKIRTSKGRKKAFSTCSAHFIVVSFQYGTALLTYMRSSTNDSLNQERTTAILFTAITPLLNPVIYTLRNKDMKSAMNRVLRRMFL